MANYKLYADICKIRQVDMVRVIQQSYPNFDKVHMSLAYDPSRHALQLVPAAEEMLAEKFGVAPGLSISPKIANKRSHDNKNKPNRLCVRINDALRSEFDAVISQMCFATTQDAIEAAIIEFCQKHRKAA